MFRSIVPVLLVVFSSLILRVNCLSVIPGSPCHNTCHGDQVTSSGDIVCTDDDFNRTTKGQTLSACLTCLRSSTYQSGAMGDSILFLYYMSTVQQTCLSGKPGEPISACSSNCSDLSSAFSNIGGRGFFQSPYAYCSTSKGVYENDAPACAICLRSQEGTVVLGNFVNIGNRACVDQPDLVTGSVISGSDQLFNSTQLTSNVSGQRTGTASVVSSTVSASHSSGSSAVSISTTQIISGAQSARASPTVASSNAKNNEEDSSGGGLSRGAAAGVGIALGLIGIAAIVLFAVLARRRLLKKQSVGAGAGPWGKMRDSPEMRQTADAVRGATPPAPGVFVPPPTGTAPKKSKSFKSLKSLKFPTPRTSEWHYAANPKASSDVMALPQRGWD